MSNAKRLSESFHEGTRHLKPPLSYLFPSHQYNTKKFIAMLRLIGVGAFAASIVIAWITFKSLFYNVH